MKRDRIVSVSGDRNRRNTLKGWLLRLAVAVAPVVVLVASAAPKRWS